MSKKGLVNDIDVLSKALYPNNDDNKARPSSTRSRPSFPDNKTKGSTNNEDRFLQDKKSKSLWSWNTLKSFTHVRNKRFNCRFSLHVHSIEGLPLSFENLTMCVKWKRRDGELSTRPVPVVQSVAEFEEMMTNTCSVYGSRSGPHHSAKYEAKHFLLYACVFGDPEVDLGKHRVDLTRLLPLTLEELEDEKMSGKWSTSYRLSGKAKGGVINVSFGYSVVGGNSSPGMAKSPVKAAPGQSVSSRSFGRAVDDVKDLHEVLPVSKSELSESVSVLYKKLEEEKTIISENHETKQDVYSDIEKDFSVSDQGTEFAAKENDQPEQDITAKKEKCSLNGSESDTKDQNFDEKELLLQELELALNNVDDFEKESGFGYEESENSDQESYNEKGKSVKLDYATENVADDFLNMLGIDHSPFGLSSESEPSSPRERLLRQFEKDSLASGSLFNFNIDDEDEIGLNNDFASTSKAFMLEDMETEALMREWGLNEKAFQRSPSSFDEPGGPVDVDVSPDEPPVELPSLGEGLGPFVQTSNGGFLRSMNPEIFKKGKKSGGNLIMQVSSPVVVPAEMGSGVMDVLQGLASVGIEKLSMQANKLMPLEDISGKTIQQIAWASTPSLEAPDRETSLQQVPVVGQTYETSEADPEYVSLEDLAPLAMNKIEALSIEGLRIQSGMSEKDAPSNISPQSIGEISALEGKRVNFDGSLGLEGTGGLQLLDVKNSSVGQDDNDDGLMGLSVTLDEWMRLDSGDIDDGDEMSERTSKILAAHHASDLMRARRGKGSKRGGLLGNSFTVALMVQLRDPLRNFEPVGTPMLALVQVERVFVPPKPKIYTSIYSLWNKPVEEEDEVKVDEKETKEVVVEESVLVPQFKITEVHVAGVKTEPVPSKKPLWGSNAKQQQAGSRWLVANGMGKKNAKHPLMKSKTATSEKSSSGSLWSISSKGKGKGSVNKVDPPVRNPNVIIPNETVRLLSGAGFV